MIDENNKIPDALDQAFPENKWFAEYSLFQNCYNIMRDVEYKKRENSGDKEWQLIGEFNTHKEAETAIEKRKLEDIKMGIREKPNTEEQ